MKRGQGSAAAKRGRCAAPATRTGAACLCALALLAGAPASAAGRHSLSYTSLTAAQWNPLGVQSDLTLGYRYRLFDSPRLVLSDTYVGALLVARANPAFARLGAGLEVQPLAVIALRALYELNLYYGTAQMIQSFPSPEAAHDDWTRQERSEHGENYATYGHQLTLQAVLRAKVGPIAVFDELSLFYHRMRLDGTDSVFYVNYFDTLAPGDGFVLQNQAHLVFLWRDAVLGLRHTLIHALYDGEWGVEGNPNTPNHRLGPILAYTFADVGPRFRKPTLIVIVNWWIDNRYRSGNAYAVAALQFTGDFLSW